jgi:hypothetical protein
MKVRNPKTGVWLDYLMREHKEVLPSHMYGEFKDLDEAFIAQITMFGKEYEHDNKRMFSILGPAIMGTIAQAFAGVHAKKRDFRQSYLTLKKQAEGQSSKATQVTQAYNTLANSVYSGKGKFTLAQYTAKHLEAHTRLQNLGEPVPPTKQVADFLRGITDPKLETGKTVIDGSPTKLGNFEICQQYVSTIATNTATRNNAQGGNRSVGAIARSDKKTKNLSAGSYTGKLHGGHYEPTVYRTLSTDQRAHVKVLREKAQKKGKGTKRKTSKVAFTQEDPAVEEEVENSVEYTERKLKKVKIATAAKSLEDPIAKKQPVTLEIEDDSDSHSSDGSSDGVVEVKRMKPAPKLG